MSWFSRKKDIPQEPEKREDPLECTCNADSLTFAQFFGQDYSYRSLSAVFACVELISNALASMPLRVVREDEEGQREIVRHHPLQLIFKNRNLQTMTMPQIIKSAVSDVLLKGNGYILINRNEAGIVTSLRYVPASAVSIQYD